MVEDFRSIQRFLAETQLTSARCACAGLAAAREAINRLLER
jgi:hypothetical protein